MNTIMVSLYVIVSTVLVRNAASQLPAISNHSKQQVCFATSIQQTNQAIYIEGCPLMNRDWTTPSFYITYRIITLLQKPMNLVILQTNAIGFIPIFVSSPNKITLNPDLKIPKTEPQSYYAKTSTPKSQKPQVPHKYLWIHMYLKQGQTNAFPLQTTLTDWATVISLQSCGSCRI